MVTYKIIYLDSKQCEQTTWQTLSGAIPPRQVKPRQGRYLRSLESSLSLSPSRQGSRLSKSLSLAPYSIKSRQAGHVSSSSSGSSFCGEIAVNHCMIMRWIVMSCNDLEFIEDDELRD